MKINYKLIGLVMFVMMICCVSAASATDVDNITVPDDTDVIEIDEAVESVDAVENDELSDDVVTSEESKVPTTQTRNTVDVYPFNYLTYFDTNGYTTTSNNLNFIGIFSAQSFGNFKINNSVNITASSATFNNIGFDLLKSDITLNGATIIMNAPANSNCIAINIENSNNTKILDNKITYTCNNDNAAYYNYVIKAKNSEKVTISGNKINATLPLKTVTWSASGIDADYVAGVAIQDCDKINFTGNTVNITGNRRVGLYPTLDAVMIVSSDNAYVGDNKIYLTDTVTATGQYSYIYGIDVYQCNNIVINNNTVDMNGNKSGGNLVGGNGTGAAYCIQLTGSHVGVVISDNTLTTKNNGPNLGIYSQNYYGTTNLTIYGNTIKVSGKAGSDPWSLVSGMELQDTYAKVYNNTICVNNTAGYLSGNCAYGISYVQTTSGSHYYDVENNTVKVYNGDYAVYLSSPATGIIQGNNLTAIGNTTKTGNSAIYAPGITPGSNP